MNKPKVIVTVNHGEDKGKTGLITGYDRDKYYEVTFSDNTKSSYKGYYLDGINKLKGHQRYLLQYPENSLWTLTNSPLSNKALAEDLRTHTNKGKGFGNARFRYFHIAITTSNDKEYYEYLTFQEVKKLVRHSLQKRYDFNIILSTQRKHSISSEPVLEYIYKENIYYTYTYRNKTSKYVGTFIRGIVKEINKIRP